jgi:hypothetical protein
MSAHDRVPQAVVGHCGNLPKRFIGPAVMLQIEADKLRIDNKVLRAKWSEP